MTAVKSILRYGLLLLLGLGIAVIWIYCDGVLPLELASRGWPPATARCLAFTATLLVLSGAPAIPIHRLFPRRAGVAAASIGWIPLALALALLHQPDGVDPRSMAIWLAAAKGAGCWAAIVVGANGAGRFVALDPVSAEQAALAESSAA